MTLEECYAALGGDYAGTMTRLQSERIVGKFIRKFPGDGSYEELNRALAAGDLEAAFRAAHTLKGICKNLGLDRLGASVEELTEALRPRETLPAPELTGRVRQDYELTLDAISRLED